MTLTRRDLDAFRRRLRLAAQAIVLAVEAKCLAEPPPDASAGEWLWWADDLRVLENRARCLADQLDALNEED